MKTAKYRIQTLSLCVFLFLPFSLNAYQAFNNNLLDFSLSVQSQSTKFKYSTSTNKVKSDQLGISWYEPFSSYFHAGLEFGYIEMTQINNSVLSALFTSGQYAGLLLRFFPVENEHFSLILDLNYRYNQTEGKTDSQQTQFSWDETVFSSEFQFHPFDKISFYLAAEYQVLSGEQRDSGTLTQISSFTEKEQQGYRFGLQLVPYRGGVVGIERFAGYRNGGRIYFKRQF